jgi:cyclopropane fatty-acyl-phospholipid synthase-like methyltransferase
MVRSKNPYNKIAEQWAESRDKSFPGKLVVDFCSKIKAGGKVLDIGCGTGYPITTYLSEHGFNITGIDTSENLLQKATERNIPNTKFLLCDFFDFQPFEKYDGVIAFDSFFHFPLDKQPEIYNKVAKWMKKGSYLLFTHGNKEGEIKGEMFEETFYYSALNKLDVHELLVKAGFEIELSIEKYIEKDSERDLVILCRKVQN